MSDEEKDREDEVLCFTRDGYPVRDDVYKCKDCTSIFPHDYLINYTNKDDKRKSNNRNNQRCDE